MGQTLYSIRKTAHEITAWYPYLQKYINQLEKVERRATQISPEIKNLDYEQRLITTLKQRRNR